MTNKTYTISSSIMLQVIDDEAMLMDMNTQKFYELNKGAVVLWKIMKEHSTFDAVINEMLECYEVSKEQVEKDLNVFIEYLISQGILKVTEDA